MQRQSPVYILYTLFSGSLHFFLMFQSYRELIIITLQFAYQNMFSRFFTFIPTDNQINLGTLIEFFFTDCLCNERTHNIDINTCIE